MFLNVPQNKARDGKESLVHHSQEFQTESDLEDHSSAILLQTNSKGRALTKVSMCVTERKKETERDTFVRLPPT
eukprot:c21198_g1_i1 orf=3-221(-)